MDTAPAATIGVNKQAARTHLNCLFGRCAAEYPQGQIELRCIQQQQPVISCYFPAVGSLTAAVDWAMLRNSEGYGVYVGVNPRAPGTPPFGCASADDIEIAFYQFADIDAADSVAILRAGSPVPYTFAVTTGITPHPRPHLYWELEDPAGNLTAWGDIQRGLRNHFESDAVIDPPRIMRLAGTVNYPSRQKSERGYVTECVTIRTEYEDDREPVSAMAMHAAFPLTAAPIATPDNKAPSPDQAPDKASAHDRLALGGGSVDPIAIINEIQAGHEWHNNVLRVVAHWVAIGRTDWEIQQYATAFTLPGYTPQETTDSVEVAIAGARKKKWAPEQVLSAPHNLLVPPPSAPMEVARHLLAAFFTTTDQVWTLRSHQGGFYRWSGQHWSAIAAGDIEGISYRWLEHAQFASAEKEGPQPWNPTKRKISDLVGALQAIVMLDSDIDAPYWIDKTDTPPREYVSMANGLLHIPTRTLAPHTPHFFCHNSLDFAYEPDAAPPVRWITFLGDLWETDASAIEALQETIGYILGGDTRQQKMFLFVGPKRAGKGTIARILTGLLGGHNIAAPTLASLSRNFGMSPLIGKPLALVSDARLSRRSDSAVVVELLLPISGEDNLTIDRKYSPQTWTGKLPTRFVFMANELPRLTDVSGALASRFIIFVLTESFYKRENINLTDQLLAEVPAIFNWAMDGLDRLNRRGYFVNPVSGNAAIQELEDLTSPVSAFMRDECEVGQQYQVQVSELWTAWKAWCEGDNRLPGTKANFGRNLHTAVPGINRVRGTAVGSRQYSYHGIGIQDK